jgi:acyl-coenzyme A synthetase/AMP-(fatty) acid ligase
VENIKILDEQINEMLKEKEPIAPSEIYDYKKGLAPKVKKALVDLDINHNNSWAVEMYRRNKGNLGSYALYYRGKRITYEKMFEMAFLYAKSLKALGFKKGDEIPVCVSHTPEYVYMFLAISLIGAKMHIFGEWFNEDYTVDILNSTKSNYVFITDNLYDELKGKIEKANVQNVVSLSLTSSLPKYFSGISYDPYEDIDDNFYKFDDKTDYIKENCSKNVLSEKEFLKEGESYKDRVVEDCSLDDAATISYSSGTTSKGTPKGIIQPNRSYITLSRFKESDISGMPSMRNLTVLGDLPTYSHTDLACSTSDTFFERCTLALEPINSKEFFPYSLVINKPNFVPASTAYWTYLCNKLNYDRDWKNVKMEYLMIPTVVGEGMSPGEEKYYNKTSRNHKFGTEKLPFPLAPVTFSIGGGTTESSGIFVTLFKSLQEKRLKHIAKASLGLTPHRFVELEVLKKNGEYCDLYEPGLLVAKTPCSMISYNRNDEENKRAFVIDKYGKKWLSLDTLAYICDKDGRVKMVGKTKDFIKAEGIDYPFYKIEDIINRDTKNILTCEVVRARGEYEDGYVCHIQFQPDTERSNKYILESILKRLEKEVPSAVLDKLYIRVRTFDEGFPMSHSGKKNFQLLSAEGISDKCQSVKNMIYLSPSKEKSLRKDFENKN